jgi:hypothetical protein
MLLLLTAALPALYWDAGPATAPVLKQAGIVRVVVPAAQANEWIGVAGLAVEAGSMENAAQLSPPSVDYQINRGGASSTPWVIGNGWLFVRLPKGRFYYDVPGPQSALAAAEAFNWGVPALIKTDAAGLKPLAQMLEFLAALPAADLPAVADIGFIDDGSDTAGEVMNLMIRGNLLFRRVTARERGLKILVKIGSPEYPAAAMQDPGPAAQTIRANLGDDRRSVRIYGTQVVVARVTAADKRLRVQLLNYAGERRAVNGIRVRVLGRYTGHRANVAGSAGDLLLDFTTEPNATEFTLRELKTFAVIDLTR